MVEQIRTGSVYCGGKFFNVATSRPHAGHSIGENLCLGGDTM